VTNLGLARISSEPQLNGPLKEPLLSMGTVRDRCYGHAEGTAGEDEPGLGLAVTVASSTGG
jgi:hypothetical protein